MIEDLLGNSINRGVICPVYLFYGTETFLLAKALKKIYQMLVPEGIGAFNYDRMDGTTVTPFQVVEAANTLPVFAPKRLVEVYHAPWFSGKQGDAGEDASIETLIAYLNNPALSTCLVMVAGEKIDTRRRIVKAIRKVGQVIGFAPLKGMELARWIEQEFKEKGKKIQRSAVDYLSAAIGNNLAVLDKEIEKIVTYVDNTPFVSLDDVVQTVSSSGSLSVFEVVDAVAKRQAFTAVLKLRELVRTGEPELKILFMLVRQIRIMLQIKTLTGKGYGEKQIASRLSLHPFVAKKGFQQCRNFSCEELVRILEYLLEADISIKTGKGEPLGIMETAIMKVCSRVQN